MLMSGTCDEAKIGVFDAVFVFAFVLAGFAAESSRKVRVAPVAG